MEATPLRNELPWRYCGRCGKPMRWQAHGEGYNRETGRLVALMVWTCPSWTRHPAHDRSNNVREG